MVRKHTARSERLPGQVEAEDIFLSPSEHAVIVRRNDEYRSYSMTMSRRGQESQESQDLELCVVVIAHGKSRPVVTKRTIGLGRRDRGVLYHGRLNERHLVDRICVTVGKCEDLTLSPGYLGHIRTEPGTSTNQFQLHHFVSSSCNVRLHFALAFGLDHGHSCLRVYRMA
ncbi:hypothetical protein BJV77DRAFT_185970 [Russula vinacea]|nr:hypothetical protein BJV77DRAFT_185970 [Russula vinacea]